jgi:hypothetical protein
MILVIIPNSDRGNVAIRDYYSRLMIGKHCRHLLIGPFVHLIALLHAVQ